ncbi:MAG TPA: 2-hydroxychromene-2-carboxylate isomerase [Candidatus Nanopelagicales bacterium]|nr:2-hydroxychromene-2-carboxylate isomerase [Candidatus Nanopelagicales bacterium]
MKTVEFWFDYSSPFTYLGATQIEATAARHGAAVQYRPFLLGGLFKGIGTPDVPMLAAPEPKRRLYLADLFRWAEHYGVPFRFPSRFPMNTVKPLRMTLSLPDEERRRLVHPMFRAYWAEDRDLSDDTTLREIAAAAGFDPEPLLAASHDERWKSALRAATDAAVEAGICGAPTFAVDGILYWGQDRLLFVDKALGGWVPASG